MGGHLWEAWGLRLLLLASGGSSVPSAPAGPRASSYILSAITSLFSLSFNSSFSRSSWFGA